MLSPLLFSLFLNDIEEEFFRMNKYIYINSCTYHQNID